MYRVEQKGEIRYLLVGEFKTKKEAVEAAAENAEEIRGWESCERVTAHKDGSHTVKVSNGTFKILVSKVD